MPRPFLRDPARVHHFILTLNLAGGAGPTAALQPNGDLSGLRVKEGMELRLTQLPYGQVCACARAAVCVQGGGVRACCVRTCPIRGQASAVSAAAVGPQRDVIVRKARRGRSRA